MRTWESFYNNIKENAFVKPKDKIILAVSGGADSMCMLHLFYRLSKKMDIDLLIVHFDHQLRKDSFKDYKAVSLLADKLKIKMEFRKLDVQKYAKKMGISIETAGRNLRYENLEEIAQKYKFNKISTAHNANDNAETVLMWLLRGSANLAGIPTVRNINKKLEIIRPLLCVRRNLIEEYVKKHKISFCTDKSNFTQKYTRNKIRLNLIPAFEKINPMVIEHICSLSNIAAREDAYLDEISGKFMKKCVKFTPNAIFLDLQKFLQYNAALCLRILSKIMPQKRNSLQINLIMKKIQSLDKVPYRLSSDWIFKINKNKAIFERLK